MILIASILMAFGVILGAFGAHYFKDIFDTYRMSVYDKASLYFFIHTLALFIIGILAEIKFLDLKQLNIVFYLLFFGIIIFSGSLYLLAILNVKWLGAITPIGGTLFIVSWLSLAFFTFKSKF